MSKFEFLHQLANGLAIDILVSPGASRTRIQGIHDGRLKMQVAAPPSDGSANKAVVGLLSKALNISENKISLIKGHTNRRKTLLLETSAVESVSGFLDEALKTAR